MRQQHKSKQPTSYHPTKPANRLTERDRSDAVRSLDHSRACLPATLALLGLFTIPSSAFNAFSPPSEAEEKAFDSFWNNFTLYKSEDNPLIQEFKIRGRYNGQYYHVDATQGQDDNWEDRRSRLGFNAKLLDSRVQVRAEFQSNDGFRDAYDGLVDAYVRWDATDDLTVTVGRTKPHIGEYDWLQSQTVQPTFERSQIFNQLDVNRATGITIAGDYGNFDWEAGFFSNSIDPDRNNLDQAFGEFNASWTASLGAGYDLSACTGWDRSDIQVNWLHSDRDEDSNLLTRYEDIYSATLWAENGLWTGVAEGYFASGGLGSDEDVFGGFLLGTRDIIPNRLELVGRYSFAHGDGDTSVRGQRRYEGTVSPVRGDSYHALYLGSQYFIDGDRIKLLAGVEYASLDGGAEQQEYDGFTYLAGVRVSF